MKEDDYPAEFHLPDEVRPDPELLAFGRERVAIISHIDFGVRAQLRFADRHWADLEPAVADFLRLPEPPESDDALETWRQRRTGLQVQIWAAIQALLGCAANVSKALWPSGKPGAVGTGRGEMVRLELGLESEDLRDRSVRNALDHADELIDAWVGEGNMGVFDLAIEPEAWMVSTPAGWLRVFHPESFVVNVWRYGQRHRVDLRELMAALDELSVRCDAALQNGVFRQARRSARKRIQPRTGLAGLSRWRSRLAGLGSAIASRARMLRR